MERLLMRTRKTYSSEISHKGQPRKHEKELEIHLQRPEDSQKLSTRLAGTVVKQIDFRNDDARLRATILYQYSFADGTYYLLSGTPQKLVQGRAVAVVRNGERRHEIAKANAHDRCPHAVSDLDISTEWTYRRTPVPLHPRHLSKKLVHVVPEGRKLVLLALINEAKLRLEAFDLFFLPLQLASEIAVGSSRLLHLLLDVLQISLILLEPGFSILDFQLRLVKLSLSGIAFLLRIIGHTPFFLLDTILKFLDLAIQSLLGFTQTFLIILKAGVSLEKSWRTRIEP